MAKRNRRRREGGGFNVWRSYSDMMAGVLLLFVLIMCVTLFQAQRNYVEKLAEQEQRIRLQDEYASAMEEKQAELEKQNALLDEQKKKLEEQNLTLDELQAALEEQARLLAEKQTTLEEQQATLDAQSATLEQQQSALARQQTTMEAQRAALDAQQATLDEQQAMLESQAQEISSKTQQLQDKQAQIDRIIGVKAEVIEALQREFAGNNVNVEIDQQTGAMKLDSNVIFAYDSAELSEEGQELLRQVLPIYFKVLLSGEYVENIGEIMIAGYTDTLGTYEYNMELSQLRSLAVGKYLVEIEEEFLTEEDISVLEKKLTVSGNSMRHPVYDSEGNVDDDASRRVEVRFRLKDEEMIEELRGILE